MPNPIEEKSISSVSEYVCYLKVILDSQKRLFRGQNIDKPLNPKIVRNAIDHNLSLNKMRDIEKKMLSRFKKESFPMLQGNKAPNNLELLSIAQHYGMPTRLLDWTANSLAALWFAVKSDPPTKVDHGVVWMITGPNVENVMLSEDIIDQNKTCFFQPPHLDNRISAQSAWFSYHRYKPRGKGRNWYLALEEHTKYEKKLTKITILKEHFGSIRQELRLYGINHASMIPDLSGLCSDIEAEFFD